MTITNEYWQSVKKIAAATKPDESELMAGDILIHHSHSGKPWSKSPYHASMAINSLVLYHSYPGGGGVSMKALSELHDDCIVFRSKGSFPTLGQQAADWAEKMGSRKGDHGEDYRTGYSSVGVSRAIGSVLASSSFGGGAKKRLAKYKEQHKPKNIICSELCVVCYQLVTTQTHPCWINLDAKYTTPWALEKYLVDHNNWFIPGGVLGKPKG